MLDRLVAKYGGKVANLFDTQEQAVSLQVGNIAAGNPAYTSGQTVVFDRQYLRGASRQDVRGALIHELTHAYGVGATPSGRPGPSVETYADYARYVLNKNEDPDWQPSEAVLQLAQERDMQRPTGTDNNGPSPVQAPAADNSHQRNNYTNQRTHQDVTIGYENPGGMAALPPLDAASTANYYAQLGNYYALYENERATLRAQRVGAKAEAKVALADVKAQLVPSLASAENAQIDRGTLGGSADMQERIGLKGAAASDRAAIRGQLHADIAASRLAEQQAALVLYQNQTGLEAEKLAQQQTMLADQLERNAIISGAESMADAQRAAYEAIMGQLADDRKPTKPPRRTRPRYRDGYTETSTGTWQTGGGF
jgi:hypothetical protein